MSVDPKNIVKPVIKKINRSDKQSKKQDKKQDKKQVEKQDEIQDEIQDESNKVILLDKHIQLHVEPVEVILRAIELAQSRGAFKINEIEKIVETYKYMYNNLKIYHTIQNELKKI